MFGNSKKEEKYDGESSDSKARKFFGLLKKAAHNVAYKIGKRFGVEKPSHYDLDVDEDTESPFFKKQRICDIVFLIYGFLAGILGQQYAEYECRAFQAFACHKSLTSPHLESSPLTIIVSIVIIFSVYLSIAAIWGCIYFLLKATLLKDGGDDEIEMLQIAAMYAVLEIVFIGLFCSILPFNMFIFAHS